jgi:hypothetical protein
MRKNAHGVRAILLFGLTAHPMMRVKALRSHSKSGSLFPRPQDGNRPSPSLSHTSFKMRELYTVCEDSFIMASKGDNRHLRHT